jgi:hypothetical protein
MSNHWYSGRAYIMGGLAVVTAATVAFAQYGGIVNSPPQMPHVYEFTEQEVQADAVVQTLNDMSKQRWEIFQVVPAWTIKNANGATELVARSYQIFAKKPVFGGNQVVPAKK